MNKWICKSVFAAAIVAASSTAAWAQGAAAQSPTLNAVKARGHLVCGVIGSSAGFSLPDNQGVMQGIDADACRAIAAAVFGDASKVKFVSLTPQQRLTALQSGEADVVYANFTWTMTRETRSGAQFVGVHYYDGVGFLVPTELKVKSAKELKGASVCVLAGPAEVTTQEYFSKLKISYKPVTFSEGEEMRKAFLAKRCDAYVSDQSHLAKFRTSLGANTEKYMMLPEVISNEPLGGAVRKGDERWFDIARYTHYAMVTAEAMGINAANVKSFNTNDPAVKRLLGTEGELGASMGLDNSWAVNVIAAVGNYGEMWTRHFASSGVPRGQNRLWNDGGLQYAPPLR
ncbi:MAG: amino acid ABC transporter substrate-binding protein [Hydrogenophaga sp.]|uniref:amino acid ABC transporter substrate-binding protein n=1 Tax=Hydrogenophaga sp. TaxID=1904254 RepID=UPI0026351C70|nr:amino acid ABC transporter substrate-binding protein [Hydrogenophaga sp.]MCV0437456.1 amino acid ABC transporter substrate-binding protein [Hydrogenophaga sp.]